MGTAQEEVKSIPHSSHWGSFSLLVRDGKIVGAEPFSSDSDPSPIVDSVREWANPELRVHHPMVREGWLREREGSDRSRRGKERFLPVTWDQASSMVAEEISRVRDRFGNASIFAGSYGWTSAGRFHHAATLLKRLLNQVGGYTGHVDTYSIAAGPVILRHTLGSDEACYGLGSTLDTVVEHTKVLLVFGSLSLRTAQNEAGGLADHKLSSYLKQLVERKVRVILISPLQDDIPSWVGAEWWPIRPGTDTALMLGLAGEIVASGTHDRHFLERYCSGADRLLRYLVGSADGCKKDAQWASNITGIDEPKISALARELSKARSMITVSWSLQRAQHGEQPFWAALALASVTGQIGLPGGGVGYGYGSTGGVGSPIGLGKSPGMSQEKRAISSFIPVARISDMLLNPGGSFTYQGETLKYPDVRMVYWAGGNPFHHHQDIRRLEHAWTMPETIVVQDPVWTPTALRADIVLPVSTSIERNDIAGNRRTSFIMAMRKAIEPIGESRSDFDIFNDIAKRLGVDAAFNEGRDEMGWIRHLYDQTRDHARTRLNFEMPTFDDFWERGFAEVPMKENYTYLSDFRKDPDANRLKTESGRIVLGSMRLAELRHADCAETAKWFEPSEWLGSDTAQDKLHLISHQPEGRLHSQLPNGAASRKQKKDGREFARLCTSEAEKRRIADGQTIRLWNARGACLAVARIDDAVRPGVIVLPTGAWLTRRPGDQLDIAGNPNVLTQDIPSSAFGQGCAAYTCLVQVSAYSETVADAFAQYHEDLKTLVSAANA